MFWLLLGTIGMPLLVQLLASQRSVVALALLAAVGVAAWHFLGRLWGDLQNMQSFWSGLALGSVAVSAVCYAHYLLPAVRSDMISNLLFLGFVCIGTFSAWQLVRSDPGKLPLNQDALAECRLANEAHKPMPTFCALCMVCSQPPLHACPLLWHCPSVSLLLNHPAQSRQPLRSRHCEWCQRCIARYSRHITTLGCCIGAKNFVLYVAGSVALVATHIMFLRFCLLGTKKQPRRTHSSRSSLD